MNITKKTWLSATSVFVLALGLTLSINAMDNSTYLSSVQYADPVTVYFEPSSNNPLDLKEEGNWRDTPQSDCGIGSYLCEVTYDATQFPSLTDFLEANPTQQDIIDNSMAHSLKN